MGVAIAKGCRGYYEPGTRAWVRQGSHKIRIPIACNNAMTRGGKKIDYRISRGKRDLESTVKDVCYKTMSWRILGVAGRLNNLSLQRSKELFKLHNWYQRHGALDLGCYKLVWIIVWKLLVLQRGSPEGIHGLFSGRVEERLTIELVEGREVEKVVTTVTKNGVVSDDDDSDLESMAGSVPKDYELGDTGIYPKEYDKKGGAIALTHWIEKMENVLDNSGCSENQMVNYDASSFVNKALT
ncbi:hypothetical protein Tco_1561855 [Tanacetum coccineum]